MFGGFKVQGKEESRARELIDDAMALEDAGVFSIVLEAVPEALAKLITEKVSVPTIGIGAGRFCDGQVLVIHDTIGMYSDFTPKFVKQYANLKQTLRKRSAPISTMSGHSGFRKKSIPTAWTIPFGKAILSEGALEMSLIETTAGLKEWLLRADRKNKSLALVPTMGFLHAGHLSLIGKAKQENDLVAVSVFVNPTQFAPGEDFQSYPRDIERDYRLAVEAGADLVFHPSVEEIYAPGASTAVEVEGELTKKLCGVSRPRILKA
jgi:cytidyltransferase-like protein